MTITDRAFIRAYAVDEPDATPPPSHLAWGPAAERPSAQASADALSSAKNAGEITHYVPPHHMPTAFVPETSRHSRRTPLHRITSDSDTRLEPSARPLSSFTQPQTPVAPAVDEPAWQPALEVRGFRWPQECLTLVQRLDQPLTKMVDLLAANCVQKPAAIVLSGTQRGEGRTTALLCLARKMAGRHLRLALVDADVQRPALAAQLGLGVTAGWNSAEADRHCLEEVLIYSNHDKLTLLPLAPEQSRSATDFDQLAVTIAQLRTHYDLVLVDAGPLPPAGDSALPLLTRLPDPTLLMMRNCRRLIHGAYAAACARLDSAGVTIFGHVDGFVSPDSHANPQEAAEFVSAG